MDYVPAHGNTNMLEDRDETSGARVFDGEDQGKLFSSHIKTLKLTSNETAVVNRDIVYYRCRQSLPHAAVTTEGLD